MQRKVSATIQRETKMFRGADNEETAELILPIYGFEDWALKLKAYRKKHHITQQELAQLMDVKHLTLRSWEQKQDVYKRQRYWHLPYPRLPWQCL